MKGSIGAIGGASAAGISEEEATKLQASQSGAWIPADAMAFDKVIHPGQLRNEIIAVLERHRATRGRDSQGSDQAREDNI